MASGSTRETCPPVTRLAGGGEGNRQDRGSPFLRLGKKDLQVVELLHLEHFRGQIRGVVFEEILRQ